MFRGVPYFLLGAVSALSIATVSCRGCAGGGPSASPLRFVPKDAQAVIEIRDLGALAKGKAELARALSDVVPPEQVSALERELELSLGFTPTTEKGLEDAGLPKEGAIAIQVADGGQSALWIIPVQDRVKLEKVIDRIARARAKVDSADKSKIGEHEVTLLQTSFGPEKALVAGYAFTDGYALIAAGSKGKALLERALTKKSDEGSIADHPEYTAIEKALPKSWEVRLISPVASSSLTDALRTIGRMAGGRFASLLQNVPEIRGVKSAGWSLALKDRGATIDGRVRLDDAALADMKSIFALKSGAPAGVSALAFNDAIVFAYFAGDPQALIQKLAPPGSEPRAKLDQTFAQVKADIDADLEKDVLPSLSGHAAFAMGIGSLLGRDLRSLMANPANVLWTVIGLGASDPNKLLEAEKKMDPGLTSKGLIISTRTTGGAEVRVISGKTEMAEQPPVMIVESVTAGGARIYSNDDKRTEAAVESAKGSAPKDPHSGKAGAVIELRFGELAKALRTLDFNALPVLYRALVGKAVQLVGVFDKFAIHFAPADDGLAFSARLQLQPEAAAQK